MVTERAELRLLRESLEAVVAPNVAQAVIFEAIAQNGGEPPAGGAAAVAFVEGPLRDALRARLGEEADSIVEGLVPMLCAIGGPPSRPSGRDADITREVVLDALPVVVFVVASGRAFARQLQSALGAARVTAVEITSIEALEKGAQLAPPHIVLVDASDFAPIDPDALAAALERLSATTVRAVWGADLPYGAATLRALAARRAPGTPFDRREGIEPLLDLVRSRRVA